MSFDIFVGCFQNGEPAHFPRAVLDKAFGSFAERTDRAFWRLSYPDRGKGDLYMGDADEIDGFMVNRPPASDLFWEALLDILRQTSSVLYWAGDGAAVADPSVIAHLPESMIESLGVPTVVGTTSEILDLIKRA